MTSIVSYFNSLPRSTKRFYLALVVIQFIQGLWAIFNYGYMGQDYGTHSIWGTVWFQRFNLNQPNSPFYYWIPYSIWKLTPGYSYLPVQAFFYLLLNTATLFYVYGILENICQSLSVKRSIAVLITFLPVRVIHSIVFAGDALTAFPFFVVIWLIFMILTNAKSDKKKWYQIGYFMIFAVLTKYSAIAMIPVLLFAILWFYNNKKKQFSIYKTLLIVIFIPSLLFGFIMFKSQKNNGYSTSVHWKSPKEPPKMNWNDIIVPKSNDIELIQAPKYFDKEILVDHRYSYPGLLHISMYYDIMDFFQDVPPNISREPGKRTTDFVHRIRSSLTQQLSKLSIIVSLPISLLMIYGVLIGLLRFKPNITTFILLLSLSIHVLFVINFSKVGEPYAWGYWLPRFIFPSAIGYLILGAHFLDKRIDRSPKVQKAIEIYSYCLGALWIFIL